MTRGLVERMRSLLDDQPGLEEKRMFGGIGFMIDGNMACGVHKDHLIVRVGPEGNAAALNRPFARAFDITGRPMNGWVMVSAEGYEDDQDLQRWVEAGVAFSRSLPPK